MWDVIVIGAGVVGCSAARALARYQIKTLVLERGSDVCSGASKGNSAMVHGGFDPTPGTNKAIYNVLGNKMFDDLCRELEVPFERSATMIFATSPSEMEEIYKLKESADQNNVPVEILGPAELQAMDPPMGPEVLGALRAPTGGIVCPYGLVIAMAECAAINGAEFKLSTEAVGFEKLDGGWRVLTNNGTFDTKIVFNCAGTHSDILNNAVSEDKFTIMPRHGTHVLLDREYAPYVKTTITQTPTPLPTGGHTKGMGIMPSVDGTVILGCDAEDVDDRDDARCTMRGNQRVIDYFRKVWRHLPIGQHVPEFPMDGVIGAYGGLRAHCDRNDFIIGEAPGAPGFINAAGIESPGLTAGPAIGVHIADMAANMLKAPPNPAYYPGRNAIRPFRNMTKEERREAIAQNPDYSKIVCRCETVTEAEIRDAIRRPLGARSIAAVKMRTRAGMGRCQGGFCSPRVLQILCEELGLDPLEVTQRGGESQVLVGRCCEISPGNEVMA